MRQTSNRWGWTLACLVALTATAAAQPNMPRVLHYEGVINAGGVPFTGALDLRFSLVDAAAQTDWQEAYTGDNAVPVADGRFRVNLGSRVPLPDAVWAQRAVYVKIAVRRPGQPDWTLLAGRQRVVSVGATHWSQRATRMQVQGPASADGPVTIGGDLVVGGDAAFNGFSADTAHFDTLTSTGAPFGGDAGGGMRLAEPLVAGSFRFRASAPSFGVLNIGSRLRMNGPLNVPGTLRVSEYLALPNLTRLDFLAGRIPFAGRANTLVVNIDRSYSGGIRVGSASLAFVGSTIHYGPLTVGGLNGGNVMRLSPEGGGVVVNGNATFNQALMGGNSGYGNRGCRICMSYGSPGSRFKRVCAHNAPGTGVNGSPSIALNGPVSGAHNFEMVYVCDGVQRNEAGFFP